MSLTFVLALALVIGVAAMGVAAAVGAVLLLLRRPAPPGA